MRDWNLANLQYYFGELDRWLRSYHMAWIGKGPNILGRARMAHIILAKEIYDGDLWWRSHHVFVKRVGLERIDYRE